MICQREKFSIKKYEWKKIEWTRLKLKKVQIYWNQKGSWNFNMNLYNKDMLIILALLKKEKGCYFVN